MANKNPEGEGTGYIVVNTSSIWNDKKGKSLHQFVALRSTVYEEIHSAMRNIKGISSASWEIGSWE